MVSEEGVSRDGNGGLGKKERQRILRKDIYLRFGTDKKCPFTGLVSIRGRILTGTVVSTKMHRTLVIRREYLHFIPKYARYEKRHKNLAAHVSPAFRVEEGDQVTVGQCRPLSKTVRLGAPYLCQGEILTAYRSASTFSACFPAPERLSSSSTSSKPLDRAGTKLRHRSGMVGAAFAFARLPQGRRWSCKFSEGREPGWKCTPS